MGIKVEGLSDQNFERHGISITKILLLIRNYTVNVAKGSPFSFTLGQGESHEYGWRPMMNKLVALWEDWSAGMVLFACEWVRVAH